MREQEFIGHMLERSKIWSTMPRSANHKGRYGACSHETYRSLVATQGGPRKPHIAAAIPLGTGTERNGHGEEQPHPIASEAN